jgi:hypothetical protein
MSRALTLKILKKFTSESRVQNFTCCPTSLSSFMTVGKILSEIGMTQNEIENIKLSPSQGP